ncbi:hypothetical protein A6V27_14195 [Hafnia alvei]|nr:hypothetical protein A6V27_14195 [Hafnia alvei]
MVDWKIKFFAFYPLISEKLIPYLTVTHCKCIQPVSLLKLQAYSFLATEKSVVGISVPQYISRQHYAIMECA